jgi:hypothetical protein
MIQDVITSKMAGKGEGPIDRFGSVPSSAAVRAASCWQLLNGGGDPAPHRCTVVIPS